MVVLSTVGSVGTWLIKAALFRLELNVRFEFESAEATPRSFCTLSS